MLKKGSAVAFYKYVEAGYTSREGENYLKVILAAHQIVANWSCMGLDWNFKRNFLTTRMLEVWKGLQNWASKECKCS